MMLLLSRITYFSHDGTDQKIDRHTDEHATIEAVYVLMRHIMLLFFMMQLCHLRSY